MRITLRTKPLRNGKLRYWIDYYDGRRLKPEILKDYWIYAKPKTHDEREHNKRNSILARATREKRQSDHDKGRAINSKDSVIGYFTDYYKNVANCKYLCKYSLDNLRIFLKNRKQENILLRDITPIICEDYADYLKNNLYKTWKGQQIKAKESTARDYMVYFRMMLKRAAKERLINFHPSEIDVKFEIDHKQKKRYVTVEELIKIYNYHRFEETRKGFLFCVNTGLGEGELSNDNPNKSLKWKHIKNGMISNFVRSKTGKPVMIALNADAIALMGERKGDNDLIFDLPGSSTIHSQMSIMCRDLKIPHTSFYCGRHTFITNSLGIADAGSVSHMTGSNVVSLQHYIHSQEELIRSAVEKLPSVLTPLKEK